MNDEKTLVKIKDTDGIREITLQRPERKNAINLSMYTQMAKAIEQAQSQQSTRVILLTGSDGCFTSGNDLEDFAQQKNKPLDKAHPTLHFMHVLKNCTKPIVVAIDGIAVGIGTTLLLHVDLVYASSAARFKMPFVSLGLLPEYASSYFFPRLVGHVKAVEYLLLAEEFDAKKAESLGLVNAVIDDPLTMARKQAAKLAALPPATVRNAKALLKHTMQKTVDEVIDEEVKAFSAALNGPEFAEAAAAFFAKRPADFSKFD